MLLMWRKCKEESNMSSLSEVDSMMELPFIQTCLRWGEVYYSTYLVSLFPEMMIQGDPPMM